MYSEAYLLAKEARSYLEALRGDSKLFYPLECLVGTEYACFIEHSRHSHVIVSRTDATDSKERQLFKARADEYFARALQLKRGLQAQFNPPPPIGGSPASSPRGPALNRGDISQL